jgi:hypothetical protein
MRWRVQARTALGTGFERCMHHIRPHRTPPVRRAMCGCGATAPAPLSVTGTPANEIAAYKILPSHQSTAGYTAIACMWEQAGARRTRPTLGEHHSLISGLVLLFASLLYGRTCSHCSTPIGTRSVLASAHAQTPMHRKSRYLSAVSFSQPHTGHSRCIEHASQKAECVRYD